MIRHKGLMTFTAIVCMLSISVPASASPVEYTASELVALPPAESGTDVTFTGEAIGEAIRSDQGRRFVNVLDGTTAVGVWMSAEQVALIDGWGEYGRTGTIVKVTGTLSVACAQHGGDFDVHAAEVELVAPSVARPVEGGSAKLVAAPLSLLTAAGMFSLYRYRRKKRWDL